MNNPDPNIRVNVDLTNPGQFFACCGLLELADRLWRGADILGAFAPSHFDLWANANGCSLRRLIKDFVAATVQQLDSDDNAASPLHLGDPFNLHLDWWRKVEGPNKTRIDLGGGDQLKPWAGKQFGPLIFRLMRNACETIEPLNLLNESRAVFDTRDGKAKKKTVSPFYSDARREETSLDIGFSPDEQDMSVVAYPAVESLALVGLQRFRPAIDDNGPIRSFLFTAWACPLPAVSAMVAATGLMSAKSCGTFRFTKPSRGGEYLTMFSRARRERSTDD